MAANPTPSKTPVWQANNIGSVNKYGAPPNTSNRLPLDSANTISTQDYTGRGNITTGENATGVKDANAANDISSPLTLTANAQVLFIPPNASKMTLVSTAAFAFSEIGPVGVALTQFVTVPANTPIELETARISQLFVTGTGPLSFFFAIL